MSDKQEGLNRLEVKAAIRDRDGHKCRDCGMDEDYHVENYGSILDVHRIIPGCLYSDHWSVTLCGGCHNKKPRNLQRIVFQENPEADGVWSVFFNLYVEADRNLFLAIKNVSETTGVGMSQVIRDVIHEHFASLANDYQI